jgi:hypothetical protein
MKLLCAALCLTGFLSVAAIVQADEKKEAKGSLTLNDKTCKLEHAFAYETTKFDMKRTVIFLSEKPLDVAKLKASFKKNGNDDDFYTFDPNVILSFDEKGKLVQISMHAKGGNIFLQGDPNIKAEATIKDGVAKGMAKSVKSDKDYTLEATFDVKLTKP